MPGPFDHGIAALLLVGWPTWSAVRGRAELRRLNSAPEERLATFHLTMLLQWIQTAAILVLWLALRRPLSALGLGLPLGQGLAAAALLAAVTLLLLWRQLRRLRREPARGAHLLDQIHAIEGLIPRTPRELRAFRWLAITAGICEELIYRGFVLWYLSAYLPFPAAVAVMSAAFGACHLYEGAQAAAQIAGIAVVAAFFYWLSGSLWIPMLLHTLFDLNQLAVVRAMLADADRGQPAAAGARA